MKLVQVFDWLKMPHELGQEFQDYYETSNDSYIRYYPNRLNYQIKSRENMNNWLLGQGMDISNCDDPYFYVLIHVSW